MDIRALGRVLSEQTKIETLDLVNMNLLKKNIEQTEQQAKQILESIPPMPEGNKGNKIDVTV